MAVPATSQDKQAQLAKAAKTYFLKVDQVEVDAQSSRPMLMRGELAKGVNLRDASQATSLMQKASPLFGLDAARDAFSVSKARTDELGMSHARLQHRHRGVPVFGSEVILHADRSGTVRSMNGQLVDHLDISTTPALSAEQALQIALQQIGPAQYRWENPAEEALLKEVYRDANRTWQPKPELVIAPYRGNFQGKDYRLTWKMRIAVDAPAPANWIYFIDAQSGDVINHFNEMESGTATTLYSGSQTIGTNFTGSIYQLYNVSRNIKTYSANSGTTLPGTLGTDADDNWTQDAMNDAHWGAERVHQYYQTVHGRNGFDNAGALMTSTAHYGASTNNATWTGSQVWYGDGDGIDANALVSLDVCGHEWTHAVIDAEAVLFYQGESGALNEGWADIFGETIELSNGGAGEWLMGEDFFTPGTGGDALRNMANPNNPGPRSPLGLNPPQPDTYGGIFWADPTNTGDGDNGGVHTNSGVANFAYFLLVNGGTGTNDAPLNNRYSVTGIGIIDARAIFYKALTDYLTLASTFLDARFATEQAASALFGNPSNQLTQLQSAWYAVGVGAPPAVPPTISSFTPASGPAGTQVTITGTNFFLGQPQVFFNGVTATNIIIDSNTQIRATVPITTTGKISVTTAGGTALSAADFIVIQQPFISSFDPGFGTPGTAVTITGTNFTGAFSVAFNGVPDFSFIFDSDTQIRATVPVGATTGKISVSNAAGTGMSSNDFIVFLPAITISDVSVIEGNAGSFNAVFTVSLSAGTGEVVTVNYGFADGTATAGSDYVALPGTLTFPAWTTSQTIGVPVFGDFLVEPDETFLVNLSGETNAIIADGQGQGTITNDDVALPTVSINDASITEGNSGTVNANFTLTLTPAHSQDVLVSFNTTDGTAIVNSDYWASSGTVNLPAGTTELTIPVIVLGDVVVEPNETFFVNLTGASNATIADGQGLGTIINDDAPPAAPITHEETKTGGSTSSATVTTSASLTGVSGHLYLAAISTKSKVTVTAVSGLGLTWTLVRAQCSGRNQTGVEIWKAQGTPSGNGLVTATLASAPSNAVIAVSRYSGVDATNPVGNVASANTLGLNGACSGGVDNASYSFNLTTTVNGAAVYAAAAMREKIHTPGAGYTERAEILQGGSGSGASVAAMDKSVASPATVAVNGSFSGNVDWAAAAVEIKPGGGSPTPSLSINDVSVTEGNAGTINAVFTATLSAASSQVVSVSYATANGTATAGSDYVAGSGTIAFPAGSTTQTISVVVNGDLLDEPNETFFVNLSSPSNATITDSQGIGTITDDDALPAISINDVSVTEGNAGTVNANFTVSLSAASGQQVTVSYVTTDGTATAGSDYVAGSGTMTFPAGTTTQTLAVVVNGDAVAEPNETFFVNLSNPVNATIADIQGQGTILDDEASLPAISINDVSVTEGTGGTVNAVFTVSLSAASGQVVTVSFATADGTATVVNDYVAVSGNVTFSAGTTTQSITVSVNSDELDEPNETFFVNLSGATNATIADGQGEGTIIDDDPTPAISINDMSVTEGNAGNVNAVFTLTLSSLSGQTVTVNYATANGTATAGSDYVAGSGTITFPAVTLTQTLSVSVLGDVAVEANETFFVNLSGAANATIADAQGQGTINNDDATASAFTDIGAALTGVQTSSVVWGDYDSDGDLDILLTGLNSSTIPIAKIYRNDIGSFVDIAAPLAGVYYSSVAWGDYDNDGDLDVLLTGTPGTDAIAKIYRNDAGSFVDIAAALTGVYGGSSAVAWGDYDNDGDLDILLTGNTGSVAIAKIYRNDAGSFVDVAAALTAVNSSSVAWGDYDNDGDLDILLTGLAGASRIAKIYRNDAGSFVDIAAALTGVEWSSVAWGDYDNDGDLDILLAGTTGSSTISKVYRNDSGSFVDIAASLTGVFLGSAAWGDYDNDGDLDILLTGSGIAKVYRNDAGSFVDIVAGLPDLQNSSAVWGDYDNDGKLDILLAGFSNSGGGVISRVYRNNITTPNTAPAAPTNLTATVSGSSVTFSWTKATDSQTPQNGLTYNLRLGTSTSGVQKVSPMASVSTGYRRIPALGNANHRASWTIKNLPSGTFYWSAQAIDHAFAGSAFASEMSFTISGTCTNIALNKTATASNSKSSNTPDKAVDGSTGTYWRSSSSGTQWWQVDLSTGTLSYSQFTIKWKSSRHAKDYEIRVSTSSSFTTYTTVYTKTGGAGGTETITLSGSPRTERYVRLHMTKVNSSYYGVNEFEVCGFSSAAPLTKNSADDAEETAAAIPTAMALQQNYPNPFNPSTTIRFDLPEAARVTLKVLNLLGQEVATLVEGWQPAGTHAVVFNAANLPSGTYFYVMQAGEVRQVRRLTLMK
jgi:Zn-dependent metalloprotease/disulfide oxidoreductase YuzD